MVPPAVEGKFICLHYGLTQLSFARTQWCGLCWYGSATGFGHIALKWVFLEGFLLGGGWHILPQGVQGRVMPEVSALQRRQTFLGGRYCLRGPPTPCIPLMRRATHLAGTCSGRAAHYF